MSIDLLWNLSVSEVAAKFGETSNSDEDYVAYQIRLSEVDFEMVCFFDEDQLQLVTYEHDEVFDDDEEALATWAALLTHFELQFGAPIQTFRRERSSICETDLAYWSRLSVAMPFRWAVFENQETRAVVVLEGTHKFLLTVKAELTSRTQAEL